jgi:hypothetical protein
VTRVLGALLALAIGLVIPAALPRDAAAGAAEAVAAITGHPAMPAVVESRRSPGPFAAPTDVVARRSATAPLLAAPSVVPRGRGARWRPPQRRRPPPRVAARRGDPSH